jgi:DNA polymerase-3 subunit gamma/tau
VRDGLSLLDQAIAMGSGQIEAAQVRAMLGLADRGRIYDLLEKLFGGAAGDALQQFAGLYGDGADPQQLLADLADAVHVITRSKALGAEAAGEVLPAEEKRRAAALGSRLSMALLSRAWQLLIKGLEESANAPNTAAAAEMVLIRLAYTADLPPPDEIIKTLGGANIGLRTSKSTAATTPALPSRAPVDVLDIDPAEPLEDEDFSEDAPPPADAALAFPVVHSFEDVVGLVSQKREAKLKVHLEEHVSLVKFDPAGSIELHLLNGAPKELANELREKLNAWTGNRWMIALSKAPGAPTLGQVQRERAAAELRQVQRDPAVAAVLQHFPDAEITVRPVPRAKKDDTGTG